MSKDELEGEDVRQHRRVRRLSMVAVTSLVLLALVASVTGVFALRNAQRATAAALEAARQQQVAVEQRGSAQHFAGEAKRQEEVARRQEARAKQATEETRRQEKLAEQQKGLAARASAEAARQQENARQQQGIADAAAVRAREQERFAQQQSTAARRAGLESVRQKEIAQKQQRLAEESAAVARNQERIAREQQRLAQQARAEAKRQEQIALDQAQLAKEAAAEADKEKANAEHQQRIAVGRRLLNQAKATIDNDPETALRLGLAAQKVLPGAEMRAELAGVVTSTHYVATLNGADAVAFSSRGILAAKDADGDLSLWNVADRGKPIRLGPLGEDGTVGRALAFSPDGRTLAVSDKVSSVLLWDVTDPSDPAWLAELSGGTAVASVAFSRDGRTLVMTDEDADGTVASLWDVSNPRRPDKVSTLKDPELYPADDFAFSPDGHTLVTSQANRLWSEEDGPVVWDVTDLTGPARRTRLPGGRAWSMAFSPTEPVLATTRPERPVEVWDLSSPAAPSRRWALTDQGSGTTGPLAFTTDGRILITSDVNDRIHLWDVSARNYGAVLLDTVASPNGVASLAVSPDGRTLVSAGGTVSTLWNVARPGAPQLLTELSGVNEGIHEPGQVLTVAFTPDGRSMATAHTDGTARIWDVTDRTRPTPRATVSTHHGRPRSLTFSSDGRILAVADADGQVTVSDISNPTRPVTVATFDGDLEWIGRMTFSPDARTLAIAGGDQVLLWDLVDPTRVTRFATLTGVQRPVEFSPDGRTLAVGHSTTTVTLWELADRRAAPVRRAVLSGRGDMTGPVAFNRDGRTLAIGSDDGTAMLWDVTDRTRPSRLATLRGQQDVAFVAFGPDGNTLATLSSADQAVRLWDIAHRANPVPVATIKLTSSLTRYMGMYRLVAFSPDGRTLAVAGDRYDDATITLWDHTQLSQLRADPAAAACARAGRGFTAEEWDEYVPEFAHQTTCPG